MYTIYIIVPGMVLAILEGYIAHLLLEILVPVTNKQINIWEIMVLEVITHSRSDCCVILPNILNITQYISNVTIIIRYRQMSLLYHVQQNDQISFPCSIYSVECNIIYRNGNWPKSKYKSFHIKYCLNAAVDRFAIVVYIGYICLVIEKYIIQNWISWNNNPFKNLTNWSGA